MATKTVSVLTGGTNNHTETAENINALGTDFISQGIVGAISATSGVAPTTGGFAVNAQGTPNMTVRVSNGVAYVTGTPTSGNSQLFRVSMSTYEDVTITANSSGSTKYDHIYIKLDATKLKDPAVDASDVATLVASRSTNASTDDGTPPTYGYKIAVVTVVNSATSIANASITDSRVRNGVNSVPLAATVNAGSLYNPYKFFAYRSTAYVSPGGTFKMPLATEVFDTSSNYDAATNYRFTAPVNGFYHIGASVGFTLANNETVVCYIYKNGVVLLANQNVNGAGGTRNVMAAMSTVVSLVAGDYLEVYALAPVTNTADYGTFGTTQVSNYFSGHLVSTL